MQAAYSYFNKKLSVPEKFQFAVSTSETAVIFLALLSAGESRVLHQQAHRNPEWVQFCPSRVAQLLSRQPLHMESLLLQGGSLGSRSLLLGPTAHNAEKSQKDVRGRGCG